MIFITGGNGLVGSFIIKKFLAEGKKIKALKRKDSDLSLLTEVNHLIEWVEGDIMDVSLLLKEVKGAELIIHAAAIVSYNPKRKEEIFKTNIEGTANIVNAALGASVPSFLHISSVASLASNQALITEESIFIENTARSNYSKSKYYAELEVYRGKEEGLHVAFLNPSIVLGPGNWDRGSSKIFKYVYEKSTFYTDGKLNFIDVRDVAEIAYLIAQQIEAVNGEKFILNAGTVPYKTFFEAIATNFKVRSPFIKAGIVFSRLVWAIEKAKSIFSNAEPLITSETIHISKNKQVYSNQKLRKILNFEFKSLKETLHWTCQQLIIRQKTHPK